MGNKCVVKSTCDEETKSDNTQTQTTLTINSQQSHPLQSAQSETFQSETVINDEEKTIIINKTNTTTIGAQSIIQSSQQSNIPQHEMELDETNDTQSSKSPTKTNENKTFVFSTYQPPKSTSMTAFVRQLNHSPTSPPVRSDEKINEPVLLEAKEETNEETNEVPSHAPKTYSNYYSTNYVQPFLAPTIHNETNPPTMLPLTAAERKELIILMYQYHLDILSKRNLLIIVIGKINIIHQKNTINFLID